MDNFEEIVTKGDKEPIIEELYSDGDKLQVVDEGSIVIDLPKNLKHQVDFILK